jgi:hypothetical protein
VLSYFGEEDLMPLMRLSEAGPEIAKSGYDVDTASIANMVFSPSLVAARIALTGTVTPTTFSSGTLHDWYYKATVTFPIEFPRPPLVMVAGLEGDGTTQQGNFYGVIINSQSGDAKVLPWYEIDAYTDHFDLFTMRHNDSDWNESFPVCADWRYWVFQNTLDA